jgi:PhnB protein
MSTKAAPYLSVRNAAAAIDFYVTAFGAKEELRLTEPNGRIGHAEVRLDDALIMLADEYPEYETVGPESRGGTTVTIHLLVDDVDAFVARAVQAGARLLREVKDEFYGERCGRLEDPFGHVWQVATRIEEIAPDEMQRRYDVLMAG